MLSEKQIIIMKEKTRICVNALLGEKLNQNEIEKKYKIPSSTVGRLLNNEKLLTEIYGPDAQFVINEIKEYQQKNKAIGHSMGGIISQENNGYTKDENGKFNGNRRK